jgi:hypothetical protein
MIQFVFFKGTIVKRIIYDLSTVDKMNQIVDDMISDSKCTLILNQFN